MKLKVIVKEFFDKKEQKYVRQEKEPVIEREDERAMQLIKAGVCEELDETGKTDEDSAVVPEEPEEEPEVESEAEPQECEAPKPAKSRKKK